MTSNYLKDLMPCTAAMDAQSSSLRRYRYAPCSAKLTLVQWLIAQFVACGLPDKEIAYMLEISAATVKAHHSKTMHVLGLLRRAQLVRYIFETGQFEPEEAERMLADRKLRRSRLSANGMLQRKGPEGSDAGGVLADVR